jgi:hypothetical protein
VREDPSGIGNDRALVERIEDGDAVLAVGPSRTPVHIPVDELPAGTDAGTWVVLDLQVAPPLVLSIDQELTRSRRTP